MLCDSFLIVSNPTSGLLILAVMGEPRGKPRLAGHPWFSQSSLDRNRAWCTSVHRYDLPHSWRSLGCLQKCFWMTCTPNNPKQIGCSYARANWPTHHPLSNLDVWGLLHRWGIALLAILAASQSRHSASHNLQNETQFAKTNTSSRPFNAQCRTTGAT